MPPSSAQPERPGRGAGEDVRIRDHLANVRTFLAWFRSGIVLFAIGYAITKFQLVESMQNRYVGVLASIAGWIVIVFAGLNFLRQRRAIESPTYRPSVSGNMILSAMMACVGIAILYYLTRS